MCKIFPALGSLDYLDCGPYSCKAAYSAAEGIGLCGQFSKRHDHACLAYTQIAEERILGHRSSFAVDRRISFLTLSWIDSTLGKRLILVYRLACCVEEQL